MPDFAGAVKAIEDKLKAEWTTTPIGFENEDDPEVTSGGQLVPWAFCEVLAGRAGIRGVGKPGDHVVVDEGDITVTVFVPRGTGRATALQLATAIGEIFRVQEFYNDVPGACVRTWTPAVGAGNSASSENPSGNWWGVTVTIPFEFIHLA